MNDQLMTAALPESIDMMKLVNTHPNETDREIQYTEQSSE